MWTAFESVATDVWILAVNRRADLFAVRVLDGFKENLPANMSGKAIPLGVLAKHRFDVKEHIGDIVSAHINFSSLKELQKAYKVAFDLDAPKMAPLESETLKRLSLLRNLIAHRNGIVDAKFKNATGCSAEIGEEVVISDSEADKYYETAKEAGVYLLRIADETIAEPSTC